MKLVTKIATIATLASFMFAGMGLTWGNSYTDGDAGMDASSSFGVHFDVNDLTTVGWEGGLMVGLTSGIDNATYRLGYGTVPTLGMSFEWWSGTGNGWATSLSTAVDFDLTDEADDGDDTTTESAAGDFSITVNLGLGF